MNQITIYNPEKLVFGTGSLGQMVEDFQNTGLKRLFIITIPALQEALNPVCQNLTKNGISVLVTDFNEGEPTFHHYKQIRSEAKYFKADAIAGIGGGSVMDIAKIVAALLPFDTDVQSVVGNGLIKQKGVYLICMPSTSGTGSEVSPNSILMDEKDYSKKGIISPFLVPDATYIDPELTLGVPPQVTAYTGIDALTHCIEAYANKFAHPVIDHYALEGIKLVGNNLAEAFRNGQNIECRSKLALGSMYGGICLGPVNTAAVHALAYPLGSKYKMPHGLSNAVMLSYIMDYNLEYAPDRYADIAIAMGAGKNNDTLSVAKEGIQIIRDLLDRCDIKSRLSQHKISDSDIPDMTNMAFEVQRLLKNNVRELQKKDIQKIYESAF